MVSSNPNGLKANNFFQNQGLSIEGGWKGSEEGQPKDKKLVLETLSNKCPAQTWGWALNSMNFSSELYILMVAKPSPSQT